MVKALWRRARRGRGEHERVVLPFAGEASDGDWGGYEIKTVSRIQNSNHWVFYGFDNRGGQRLRLVKVVPTLAGVRSFQF